jgi:hypothetical protein
MSGARHHCFNLPAVKTSGMGNVSRANGRMIRYAVTRLHSSSVQRASLFGAGFCNPERVGPIDTRVFF